MERRKRKPSERSCGESEASESVSSQSEIDSDGHPESIKGSLDDDVQSPEASPKTEAENEDAKDSIGKLTEKLSAALVDARAKDDMAKQHAKVAEEAVAGWEKAENEVAELKQKLEVAANENSTLEDRLYHLDEALKECVRQLRQAREGQEQKIQEAVTERTHELESAKTRLENRVHELQTRAEAERSEGHSRIIESLATENSTLKHELLARREELEIRKIERDLSTRAAETASKQHLDSIKKVAKLEAECRKLRVLSRSSLSVNDHRSADSRSDGGERTETGFSDSWVSALIAELDHFKNEKKTVDRSVKPASSFEIDLMGDFLEMERLAALPETRDGNHENDSELVTEEAVCSDSSFHEEVKVLTHRNKDLEEKLEKMKAEKTELEGKVKHSKEVENTLRSKLEASVCDIMELEDKLEKMEAEKAELQISCDVTKDKYEESQVCLRESQLRLQESEMEMEKIQKELKLANESKSQVESLRAESQNTYAKTESLEEDTRKEKEQNTMERENAEPKIKQEDIAAAAGKLAECQKTIASLGKQLHSLAALEDFLTDTATEPGFSAAVSAKNGSYSAGKPTERIITDKETTNNSSRSISPLSSASTQNGFAKFFTLSKNVKHLEK